MDNKTFIGEGHYSDDNGNEYMSIWTFQRKNGISGRDNFQDAKDISCNDKFFGPFSKSNEFKKGYMYNVNCLQEFYSK